MPNNKGKINITIISGGIYPFVIGGAEIFIYFLIKELSKSYQVTLISQYDPGLKGVKFVKIRNLKPFRFFYPLQLFYLLFLTKTGKTTLYTSYMKASWLNYIPIALFSALTGVPYVFTIHGGGLSEWKFKLPYLYFFSKAKGITGVSHRICQEYNNRTRLEIKFLPPLIPFLTSKLSQDSIKTAYEIPQNKKIFLFVGSLKPLKNPQHILEAMKELGEVFLNENKLFFVFAGDGVLKEELQNYCYENRLDAFVCFLGNVSVEFIHELYNIADYYIMCSDFEGTPISLLEAMYNQLPIIASDAPGINNILTHNKTALLYSSGCISELVSLINLLINDDDKRNEISIHAKRIYDEQFNFQEVLTEYSNLICKNNE